MNSIIRNSLFTVIAAVLAVLCLVIPKSPIRLGKDLQGGVSLMYGISIDSGENPDEVIPKVIDVLKQRVDPNGLTEISIVRQGRDRIEITMPLPNDRVKRLKQEFEDQLAGLSQTQVSGSKVDQALALPAAEREAALATMAGGAEARLSSLRSLAAAYDLMRQKQEAMRATQDAAAREALAPEVAQAEIAFEAARASALTRTVSAEDIRRVVLASTRSRSIRDGKEVVTLDSPRQVAERALYEQFPESKAAIDSALGAWRAYSEERGGLDDPQDLIRMLKGAGVLSFRITIDPGAHPQEQRLRAEVAELGPANVKASDARWMKINSIEGWIKSKSDADAFASDPGYARVFFGRMGFVVEPYSGDYYMLCWDTATARLTQHEGAWAVSRAYPGADNIGRPAIHFNMNAPGSVKLGNLTRAHVNDKMAVLLDDEVYTAPRLNSEISSGGIIEGDFDPSEIQYIVRVLGAGSLQGKLSPEPVSINSVGPDLGADNLDKGLLCGIYSIIIVAAFMIVYYFGCGAAAVFALAINSVLIMGAMALSKAAFTMPGIAGVILTFGMAVDSNVLIYERMREELSRGADLRTAVRLGFDRALASIVDGNVTNLIVCVVLYQFGTPEIRGFAITMGIGVVSTLFAALIVTRLPLDLAVAAGLKGAPMLPSVIPGLQRMLTPSVGWIRLRWVFMGISAVYVALGLFAVVYQGPKMLDTEFAGGTAVTLEFKPGSDGQRMTLTREDVQKRVQKVAEAAPEGTELRNLNNADVIPINPEDDGVTSGRFTLKVRTKNLTGPEVLGAVIPAFQDLLPDNPRLSFKGDDEMQRQTVPAYPIDKPVLGPNIDRPEWREDVRKFLGGVAIVAEGITPAQPLEALQARWQSERQSSGFSDTLGRTTGIVILEGTEAEVRTAVFLVKDDQATFFDNEGRWDAQVRAREWSLLHDALTRARLPASVQSFSPSIASTFQRDALLATVVSFIFIGIYIWIRFKTPRYSIAAIVALVHDVLTVLGLLALAEILCEHPATRDFAYSIGLLPFKIDLNTVAALLTIAGYSLNDTVVVMDRIRENRGKLPAATARIIDDSVNQTFSRTIITGGTTMLSCLILYIYGGEGMRSFAFCLLTGLIVGTYSSVAVAAPIVWSRKFDRDLASMGGIVARPA
ncbi:MAG: protein translocase subunit SecD [Phycisphaerales bacterium]|nr:protein translocase subunit SecD [Phycisphaerales bacterium]